MNETEQITAFMEAFRLLRGGVITTYHALKTELAEMYPNATDAEIRDVIRKLSDHIETDE